MYGNAGECLSCQEIKHEKRELQKKHYKTDLPWLRFSLEKCYKWDKNKHYFDSDAVTIKEMGSLLTQGL